MGTALIRVVGIFLVIALLTIPPAVAKLFSNDLKDTMLFAICFGIFFSFTGLYLSYQFNISSGATIVLLAGFTYLLGVLISSRLESLK